MIGPSSSRATQFLNRHPGLRERVAQEDEFRRLIEALPTVTIDGVDLYFPEGDIQKERDDVIVDYALAKGIVSPRDLD